MNFIKRLSKNGDKVTFYYDYGRGPGQRPSTGIFIYTKPKNEIQKKHNKEALTLLEVKKSQLIIEQQAVGSAFIPTHKFKANFLEYYEEYIKLNARKGNRHLQNGFANSKPSSIRVLLRLSRLPKTSASVSGSIYWTISQVRRQVIIMPASNG